MQWRELARDDAGRRVVLVFDCGDTVMTTLELVLHEIPAHLSKRYDPASGRALIAPQEQ